MIKFYKKLNINFIKINLIVIIRNTSSNINNAILKRAIWKKFIIKMEIAQKSQTQFIIYKILY